MPKHKPFYSPIKIGLALGGGGARGLAHLGVFKVLEAMGIFPSVVVGSSMGSIIGALYCYWQNAALTEEKVLQQLSNPKMGELGLDMFAPQSKSFSLQKNLKQALDHLTRFYMLTSVMTKDHLIAEEKIKTMLTLLLPDIRIEELPLRFAAVATDILQGQPYVFREGPLILATQASAAIPGVFPPVQYQTMRLVDGCIVSLTPVVETFALGADFVIAVDVTPPLPAQGPFKTAVEIWLRADQITNLRLRDTYLQKAQAVIQVENLTFPWHAFYAAAEIIVAGEEAARQAQPKILQALRNHPRFPWWRRWFPLPPRPPA